jgi:threonine-phosphate decarboxylase
VEQPEFSLYERHLARLDPAAPRWRSNPSNPLGRLAARADVADVWDEAFWPLAAGTWTRGDDAAWRVGSLTKLWACPGLRLGYVIAPDDRSAAALVRRQPRWSVGSIGLSAIAELVPRSDLRAWRDDIGRRRASLVDELRGVGLAVRDTEACWVLVDEPGLRERLLPHGVIVRDCASFGLAGVHRVAVPSDRDGERLVAALAAEFG